jgi:PKHD-type hydroxylase
MSHLPIWLIGQIPTDVCDAAVREFMAIEPQDATMGVEGEVENKAHRDTVLRFAPEGHWFGGIMQEHGRLANLKMGWDYELTGHENVQFGSYGPNGHYGWHTDTFTLSGLPIERKVSVVCMMSDRDEYEGGELQIRLYQEYTADLKKGDIIAFPSILEHRVIPVISGMRSSAVVWLNGPRMR